MFFGFGQLLLSLQNNSILVTKKGTKKMSFTIMQHNGMKVIQWFFNIDELIKAMLNNPKDRYYRNP
jgi:hypothetical protein